MDIAQAINVLVKMAEKESCDMEDDIVRTGRANPRRGYASSCYQRIRAIETILRFDTLSEKQRGVFDAARREYFRQS